MSDLSVISFAQQILAMQAEIEDLRYENAELQQYRKKYDELLKEGVSNGKQMMAGWLVALTNPDSVLVRGMKEKA